MRYDCRADSAERARLVIAEQAHRAPTDVHDVARTCGVFAPGEVGDPR